MIRAAALKWIRRLRVKRAALRSWWLGVRVRWFWASPWGGRLQKQGDAIQDLTQQIGMLTAAKEAAEKARDWERSERMRLDDQFRTERARSNNSRGLWILLVALVEEHGGAVEIDERRLERISENRRVEIQRDPGRRTTRLVVTPAPSYASPPDSGFARRSGYADVVSPPPEILEAMRPKRNPFGDPDPTQPTVSSLADAKIRTLFLEDAFLSAEAKVREGVHKALADEQKALMDEARRAAPK